ncbi:MAG: hypothetical protein A2Z34_07570, partial [Planctomycetes bacterium RBG_16_59_8]
MEFQAVISRALSLTKRSGFVYVKRTGIHGESEVTHARRIIDADQVNLLIREGDGLTVEFKERYTPRIDEDIVAFANARGGTLLLGVRDDLLTQFNEAIAFLKKHLNIRTEIKGLDRKD